MAFLAEGNYRYGQILQAILTALMVALTEDGQAFSDAFIMIHSHGS